MFKWIHLSQDREPVAGFSPTRKYFIGFHRRQVISRKAERQSASQERFCPFECVKLNEAIAVKQC
jgi:hypothetical protein